MPSSPTTATTSSPLLTMQYTLPIRSRRLPTVITTPDDFVAACEALCLAVIKCKVSDPVPKRQHVFGDIHIDERWKCIPHPICLPCEHRVPHVVGIGYAQTDWRRSNESESTSMSGDETALVRITPGCTSTPFDGADENNKPDTATAPDALVLHAQQSRNSSSVPGETDEPAEPTPEQASSSNGTPPHSSADGIAAVRKFWDSVMPQDRLFWTSLLNERQKWMREVREAEKVWGELVRTRTFPFGSDVLAAKYKSWEVCELEFAKMSRDTAEWAEVGTEWAAWCSLKASEEKLKKAEEDVEKILVREVKGMLDWDRAKEIRSRTLKQGGVFVVATACVGPSEPKSLFLCKYEETSKKLALPSVDATPTHIFTDLGAFAKTTDPRTCTEWHFEGKVPSYLATHAKNMQLDPPRSTSSAYMEAMRAHLKDPFGIQQFQHQLQSDITSAAAAISGMEATKKRTYDEAELPNLFGLRPSKLSRANPPDEDSMEEEEEEETAAPSPPPQAPVENEVDMKEAPFKLTPPPSPPPLSFSHSSADAPMGMPTFTSNPRKRTASDLNANISATDSPVPKKTRMTEGDVVPSVPPRVGRPIMRAVRCMVTRTCLGASLLLRRLGAR